MEQEKKLKTQNKLSTRQHILKDYLKDNFVSGKFFSIEEIIENVKYSDGTPCYVLNHNPRNHDKCATLSEDIRTINWSMVDGWKIIIKNDKGGCKLAENKEEFDNWYDKEYAKANSKIVYLNVLKSKANDDKSIPLYKKNLTENKSNTPIESYANVKTFGMIFVDLFNHKLYVFKNVVKYNFDFIRKQVEIETLDKDTHFTIGNIVECKPISHLERPFYKDFIKDYF